MLILTFLLCFIAAAFVSAAFFDFIWNCIGAPEFDERGRLHVRKRSIFGRYGAWVARKFNEVEDARELEAHARAAAVPITAEQIKAGRARYIMPSDEAVAVALRQEIAEDILENDARLNWYMPLGACSFCFSVWVHLINAAAALYFVAPAFNLGGIAVGFCFVYFPAVAVAIRAYFSDTRD